VFILLPACAASPAGGDDDDDSPGADAGPGAPDADPQAPDGGDTDAMPPPPATGNPTGLVRGTGDQQQEALGVATDSDGSYVVVGQFQTGIDLGTGFVTASPNGSVDAFIARFAADGTPQWTHALGTCDGDYYNSVVVAADHSIWVSGGIGNGAGAGCAAIFDGAPVPTTFGHHGVVAHYGMGGEELDLTFFGGSGSTDYNHIALDSSGEPVIAGIFNTTFTFSNGVAVTNPDNNFATYVAALDTLTLGARWATSIIGSNVTYSRGVVALPGGDVIVAGDFSGSTDTHAVAPLVSTGSEDVYLARYGAQDGSEVWSQRYGGINTDNLYCAALVPGTSDVIFGGSYAGTAYFGGAAQTANGSANDAFLARVHEGGEHVVSTSTSTVISEQPEACTADIWGNMVIGGARSGDAFLAKTDAAGTYLWDHDFISAASHITGVAVRPDGKVVAVGYFEGTLTIDGLDPITGNGRDAFVLVTEP
jgi:hypothetical protein